MGSLTYGIPFFVCLENPRGAFPSIAIQCSVLVAERTSEFPALTREIIVPALTPLPSPATPSPFMEITCGEAAPVETLAL